MKTTTTLGYARPLLLALCLWLLCGGSARSQEFTVSSFRLLPNDVSAFVNSVRDLNDEACALVKVEAPSDFAFSTPLGIVKRKDEVGEIWLYLPQGTKMLTLKHPVWGVLRDYQLGTTLESRMTYELKVDVPRLALAERHDTIVQVRTIIDTVTVTQSRPKEPWSAYALATIGAHDNGPSYGVFFSLMRRHGFFVHANTLFGSIGKTRGSCAKDGSLGEGTERPYYSGKTAKSHFTITAGATLHGSATVAGETEMPQLYFRYGATEAMEQTAPAVFDDQTMVVARITGLTAATTYHYMLEGTNGRTTVRGDRMSLTTLPNAKPSLGEASIIGHGPMSVIIGYRITDDGGETITETGCLYALASAAADQQRVVLKDYRKDQERQTLLLPDLRRNTTYMIWPYATSRMGETVGEAITFTTGDALLLGEPGQLRSLMGKDLYDYSHLSIAGPLNGDDLRCLREMMGRGRDNVATAGRLSDIDLTDATIVAGGEPYDDARYAEDDVVGQGLFADCASLSKIVLPSQTTTIEKDAFARCAALELIDIPAAAASVMPSGGCSALQSLRVSEANTHYVGKDGVLLNADTTQIVWFPMGKKGSYTLPSSVTSVGSYAFKECSIERFVFSDHVAKLGTGVFMNSKVRDVTMPEALRLVPTATFQGCAQLQVVRLGSKTELISDYAFTDCPLTDLYVEARMPPVCQPTAFATLGADVLASCRVHVPKGRANIYKASEGWNLFKNIITD